MSAEKAGELPDGDTVAAFLGQPDQDRVIAMAKEHVPIVAAMARSYTRGQGFDDQGDPYEDVAAVITTATARLVTNPGLTTSESAGAMSTQQRTWDGWTLAETFVLNRYRKRAT